MQLSELERNYQRDGYDGSSYHKLTLNWYIFVQRY